MPKAAPADCARSNAAIGPGRGVLQPLGLQAYQNYFFFLPTRCVSADPAALLAALLDLGSRKTLAAFDAATLPVTSPFPFAIILPFIQPLWRSALRP